MVRWIWLSLAMLAMIAVLSAYDTPIFQSAFFLSQQPTKSFLLQLMTLLVVGVALAILSWLEIAKRGVVKVIVSAVLCILIMLGFGFRAFMVYGEYEATRPKHALQVSATVSIYEISDSVYNPAIGSNFRQKAVLSNIRLADGTSANLPETLTVLLIATAHKPSKTRPTDPLADVSQLSVGTQADVVVKLAPLNKQHSGFDSYKWLATRHIQATAQLTHLDQNSIRPLSLTGFGGFRVTLEKLRQHYRSVFFDQNLQVLSQDKAVALSLLTGDRAFITQETKALYQYGGVSHLLAISGSHILFLAVVLANMAVFLVNRYAVGCYKILARWQLRLVIMLVVSLIYALFTGFEVPAMRTVLMLAVLGLGRYLLLGVSSLWLVALTALVMAYVDPLVLWQAGFWLSFLAVAVLVLYEQNEPSRSIRQTFIGFGKLQLLIFVAMLPLSLLIFDKVSLFGLFVNLFAVSLFGFVIVPINLLAGVIYAGLPSVADMLWQVSAGILAGFEAFLKISQLTLGERWLSLPMGVAVVLLFFMAFLVMTTKVLPKRFAILPILMAGFGLMGQKPPQNTIIIEALAVENGVSAILMTHEQGSWLILAGGGRQIKEEKLVQTLSVKIRQKTPTLMGVIIQDDNESLAKAVGRLSLELPVYELWWAGREMRFGKLTAQRCMAGKTDDFFGGRLEILTGWDFAKNMNTCTVFVRHEWSSQIITANHSQSFDDTAIVIDNSQEEKLWAVYRLLCQSVPSANVFLTHSQSLSTRQDVAMFGDPVVAFGDNGGDTPRLKELTNP